MLYKTLNVAQDSGGVMDLQMPLAQARRELPALCRRAREERTRIVLTKYGEPIAAIVPVEDVQGLQTSLSLPTRRDARRAHVSR